MNDRIKEIAEQAMQYAEQLHGRFHEGHEDPNWDTYIAFQQKFAELIVKECAKIVEDNIDPQNAWITPAHIKDHFGIQ